MKPASRYGYIEIENADIDESTGKFSFNMVRVHLNPAQEMVVAVVGRVPPTSSAESNEQNNPIQYSGTGENQWEHESYLQHKKHESHTKEDIYFRPMRELFPAKILGTRKSKILSKCSGTRSKLWSRCSGTKDVKWIRSLGTIHYSKQNIWSRIKRRLRYVLSHCRNDHEVGGDRLKLVIFTGLFAVLVLFVIL